MTHRVARPMKFAAFISIIISLVVLFAACEAGAPGKAGNKGDKGDKGDPGTPGTAGTPGANAFQARTNVDAVLLSMDELVDDDGRMVDNEEDTDVENVTKKFTIDPGNYFAGGAGDNTYEIGAFSSIDVVTVEVNDDNMIEYTITLPTGGFTGDEPFATGYSATLTGTDANGVSQDASVTIKINRAPTIASGATDGVVNSNNVLVLGTMDGDREDALDLREDVHMECTKISECVLDAFNDDGDLEISVTGMTQQGKSVSGLVGYTKTDSGAISLMGMASTAIEGTQESVTVTLEAVDEKGLKAEAKVLVRVDAAPKVTTLGQSYAGSSHDVDGSLAVTTNAAGWFEDDDATTLNYSGESGDMNIATIDGLGNEGALPSGNGVTIAAVALGQSTTITITATESGGLGQSVSVEFTVNITGVGSGG